MDVERVGLVLVGTLVAYEHVTIVAVSAGFLDKEVVNVLHVGFASVEKDLLDLVLMNHTPKVALSVLARSLKK